LRARYWLDICHHLHISPREQDEMTFVELHEAVKAIDHIRAEAAKAK
jgi:hypothetical protein